ncbi:DoxX family protein [Nocardia miyunensis]|uniref:DoxX family protein n=1 Tax=Nocardia miyunensis TaxID=282684 RepID=UPI000AB0D678|nr:DoxX family protein [Nocardia miyunensis]
MQATDVYLLIVRVIVGGTMVIHGWNHAFGGGRIAGTAGWFAGLGLRPGRVHAWASVVTEIGCGAALTVGFLTPLAAGGLFGTMVVAGVIEHRSHGFFVFRNGYEYVLMIAVVLAATAIGGGGRACVDYAVGFRLSAATGLAACLVIGIGGAAILLGLCWRPRQQNAAVSGRAEPSGATAAATKGEV